MLLNATTSSKSSSYIPNRRSTILHNSPNTFNRCPTAARGAAAKNAMKLLGNATSLRRLPLAPLCSSLSFPHSLPSSLQSFSSTASFLFTTRTTLPIRAVCSRSAAAAASRHFFSPLNPAYHVVPSKTRPGPSLRSP